MRVAQPHNEMTGNNSRRRISEPGLKAHSHGADFLAITAIKRCGSPLSGWSIQGES